MDKRKNKMQRNNIIIKGHKKNLDDKKKKYNPSV
jgi:hypothetical protein